MNLQKNLAIATLALAATSTRANLLANPGFETGDFSGWTTGVSSPSVIADGYLSAYSALFVNTVKPGTLAQKVSTTPGQLYRIDLMVKNYGVGGDFLDVSFGGVLLLHMDPIGTPLEDWTPITLYGVAAGGAATLALAATDPDGVQIDDCSVEAVPEPVTALSLGLGACLLRRSRKPRV